MGRSDDGAHERLHKTEAEKNSTEVNGACGVLSCILKSRAPNLVTSADLLSLRDLSRVQSINQPNTTAAAAVIPPP